jgi:hypothetical protein
MKMKKNTALWLVIFLSAMFMGGCQAQDEKGRSPIGQLITKLLPENADSKQKKMMKNLSSPDPDLRREGVVAIRNSAIRDLPATHEVLSIMARGDLDPQVRATALETLVMVAPHYEKLSAVLDSSVKDASPLVRRQSVMILAGRNDPADMDLLLDRLASDDDVVVRTTAASAMGNYTNRKVLRVLIDHLEDEFSVAYQSRRSLQKLTGRDFDYDKSRWQSWLSETSEPFAASASNSGS